MSVEVQVAWQQGAVVESPWLACHQAARCVQVVCQSVRALARQRQDHIRALAQARRDARSVRPNRLLRRRGAVPILHHPEECGVDCAECCGQNRRRYDNDAKVLLRDI
jgi:hypothetical protein